MILYQRLNKAQTFSLELGNPRHENQPIQTGLETQQTFAIQRPFPYSHFTMLLLTHKTKLKAKENPGQNQPLALEII